MLLWINYFILSLSFLKSSALARDSRLFQIYKKAKFSNWLIMMENQGFAQEAVVRVENTKKGKGYIFSPYHVRAELLRVGAKKSECQEVVLWSPSCSLIVHALLRDREVTLSPCPSSEPLSVPLLWTISDPIPLPSPTAASLDPVSSSGILAWFKCSFCLKILHCFLNASVVYYASLHCDQVCCVDSTSWQDQMLCFINGTTMRKVPWKWIHWIQW